jgi:hypothetical protein
MDARMLQNVEAIRIARLATEDQRETGDTQHCGHQPHRVALGGGCQAVAGGAGVAGFDTVDTGIAAQQTVAVLLAMVVPDVLLL